VRAVNGLRSHLNDYKVHVAYDEFARNLFTHAAETAEDVVPVQVLDLPLHALAPDYSRKFAFHDELKDCDQGVEYGADPEDRQDDGENAARVV
jgi:hypothetical protein